ncbi:MAG: UvrD-helicase domain-containing protein [Phycisphaerae bacterium]|nr:UvrD-helicase domain-containing protein [Phycisphaerae bacterium]
MTATHATTRLLADLNEPQRQAVAHRDGPLLVLAGPGSGKTRVITRRAANLVQTGVAPRHILAITFTNKAADEMRQRIAALGIDRGMWVYTFHALGVRLLREFGPLAHIEPGFSIYDEADQKRLVKEAMALCQFNDQLLKPERALSQISAAKNRLETPEKYAERSDFFDQRMIARIYEAYEQLLRQRNAVDFDDLLMRVAVVLRDHAEIVERLNIRFQYLLIDEYQDTNHAQYLIAKQLSKHHHNICATGDPDQSIYGWRGADISNILEFERDYPEATIVRLEENYRSTKHILRAASQLIRNNRKRKHKDLWTHNAEGEPVTVCEFDEGRDEAEHIAETIAQAHESGEPYGNFAIMYRVNAISRGLEEALRFRGMPYRIARGVEFYNRREIRDTLAYLRVLANPADDIALLRIINTPARGIGNTTIGRMREYAEEHHLSLLEVVRRVETIPSIKTAARKVRAFADLMAELKVESEGAVADAVGAVLKRSGLEAALKKEREEGGEDRIANVEELVSAAARYDEEIEDPTLEDFLQRVSLTSDQDAIDENADAVLLLTLHAAKGLEFPTVFIVGLEQGMLPHDRALQGDGDIEEERRLAFVGITRAERRLYVSHAAQRFLRGVMVPRCASQFLDELPDDAVTFEHHGGSSSHTTTGGSFVPMDDQLPPDEQPRGGHKRREWPRKQSRTRPVDEDEHYIDVAAQEVARAKKSPYADWTPGTFVEHKMYGVGQVVWIRPGPGQTRAAIRFARHGEKTFILELTPIQKLERGK